MIETHAVSKETGKSNRHRYHPDRFPFLPAVLAGAIRSLLGTCRIAVLGEEHEEEALKRGGAVLHACWHFAYPAVIYHYRDRNGVLMVSRSRDGEWIARVLKHLGYQAARGSPGKGGGIAIRELIAHVRAGSSMGLVADGSQGPACEVQKGILILARHTRAPIVPVSMAAHPCWRFPTWDRTVLPKPFSRVVMAKGAPIWVGATGPSGYLEEVRLDLQRSLNRLTRQAEEALAGPRLS